MRRRFLIFLGLLGLIFVYLGIQLFGTHLAGWVALALSLGLIFWMPLVYWKLDDIQLKHQRMAVISYLTMAILSFVLTLTIGRDLLQILLKWVPESSRPFSFSYSSEEAWIILGLSLLMLAWGYFQAFFGIHVSHVDIPLEGIDPTLAAELDGFKIAQLSDIHIGPSVQDTFLLRVIHKVNANTPDILAITGDTVDGEVKTLKEHFKLLARIQAPHGKFYITGNHEFYWDPQGWIDEAARIGLIPLVNSHRLIQRGKALIAVAGISDFAAREILPALAPDAAKAIKGAPAHAYRILLAHQPQAADEAEKLGFQLQLSGHTHAGQFIPWTWVVRFFHQYYKGLNQRGKLWIYVNRGTGHWGPPVRIGARPEITLLTLRK